MVPMFTFTSAESTTAANMEARRQAIGAIAKVAKLALGEVPPDPRSDIVVDFDRCWDRKYTTDEMTVKMTERKMP